MNEGSIRFDHENDKAKTISVNSYDKPIDNISVSKKTPQQHKSEGYDPYEREVKDTDSDDAMGMEFIANPSKLNQESSDEEESDSSSNGDTYEDDNSSTDMILNNRYLTQDDDHNRYREPEMSYEEIQQQKAYYLSQLKRLANKGHPPSRFLNIEHPLNEIKGEVYRIKKEIEVDKGIDYCRQALIFCVSTIERLNSTFDPFNIKLDGWSNSVMSNQENYDDVFEELYEKYKESANMAPEMRLMFMVGGSAFMYHLNQTMFKGLAPSAQDVFNQNPDLLRQFNDAAMRQAGGNGFANMMGMMGSGGSSAPPPPKFPGMGMSSGLNGIPGAGRPNINNTDDVDAMIANITSS